VARAAAIDPVLAPTFLTRADEARAVLNEGIAARRDVGDRGYTLDRVEARRDRVVVAFSWFDKEGQRHTWAQALRLKDEKIVEMQDYASPARAIAVLRLRTVLD
jgi:NADPH-dependent ferric siderophore reductase